MKKIAILALLFSVPMVSSATIYRWNLPDGEVAYGDHPPAQAYHIQKISGAPSVTAQAISNTAPTKSAVGPTKSSAEKKDSPNKRKEMAISLAKARLLQAENDLQYAETHRLGNERNYARYQDRLQALRERVQIDTATLLALSRK